MQKIIYNETTSTGIKGAPKKQDTPDEKYRDLVNGANEKIKRDQYRYALAYIKAATCFCD